MTFDHNHTDSICILVAEKDNSSYSPHKMDLKVWQSELSKLNKLFPIVTVFKKNLFFTKLPFER